MNNQNKICSINFINKKNTINSFPILFRIVENTDIGIVELLRTHFDEISENILKHVNSFNELLDVKLCAVVYDIDNDKYEQDEYEIFDVFDISDSCYEKFINEKLKEYAAELYKRIFNKKMPEKLTFTEFVEKLKTEKKTDITEKTFNNYLMSCLNDEFSGNKYIAKFKNSIYDMLKNKVIN